MANVLIFGATSAIAQAVALRYAARGDRLYVVGRNPAKLERLVDQLGAACVGYMVAAPLLVCEAIDQASKGPGARAVRR